LEVASESLYTAGVLEAIEVEDEFEPFGVVEEGFGEGLRTGEEGAESAGLLGGDCGQELEGWFGEELFAEPAGAVGIG